MTGTGYPVLSDCELALMQQVSEVWMPDRLDVYRITTVDDIAGGRTPTETIDPNLQDVPCSIQSGVAQEQERVIADKIKDAHLFQITVPADTAIEVGDHVTITTRTDMHMIVQAVFAPESWETERRILASMETSA